MVSRPPAQVRERQVEGQFEDGATVQLLKLHVAQQAGRGLPWVEARLGELVALVPDIVAKLPRVKADLLLRLVSDTPARPPPPPPLTGPPLRSLCSHCCLRVECYQRQALALCLGPGPLLDRVSHDMLLSQLETAYADAIWNSERDKSAVPAGNPVHDSAATSPAMAGLPPDPGPVALTASFPRRAGHRAEDGRLRGAAAGGGSVGPGGALPRAGSGAHPRHCVGAAGAPAVPPAPAPD